jgi:hypothetical protein
MLLICWLRNALRFRVRIVHSETIHLAAVTVPDKWPAQVAFLYCEMYCEMLSDNACIFALFCLADGSTTRRVSVCSCSCLSRPPRVWPMI